MFENLVLPPPDEILELMHEFRTDSKIKKAPQTAKLLVFISSTNPTDPIYRTTMII